MKEKLQEDLKTAMKAHDQLRLNTIRGVIAEIKKSEIDAQKTLSADEMLSVVNKEIKKRRDAIEFAKTAARAELVAQNEAELKILQGYVGEPLNTQQLTELVASLIKGGADNVGKIMGALNKEYKGRFEGKAASDLAKQLLGS